MTDAPRRHVFLSYMREDKERVDALQDALEAAGLSVWRDVDRLWPGEDWAQKIREAIQRNSLAFVACFSSAAAARDQSYQYEELTIAVEEYRKRPPGATWLFTVRFDEVDLPTYDLGYGRMLGSHIQRSDLFGASHQTSLVRLVTAVARVMEPAPTVATDAVAAARTAGGSARERSDTMKALLRDANGDIALEGFMRELGTPIRDALADDARFPATADQNDPLSFYAAWAGQIQDYEQLMQPCLEPIRLAGYYGRPEHTPAWNQFMRLLIARVSRASGRSVFVELRGYPALLAMYTSALAAVARQNYVPLLGFVVEPRVRDELDNSTRSLAYAVDSRLATREGGEILASALSYADDGATIDAALIASLASRTLGRRFTPMSEHLHHILRDLFVDDFPNDHEFEELFDRASILLDALAVDSAPSPAYRRPGGYGSYLWRERHELTPLEARMLEEARNAEGSWKPIQDGLFGGRSDRAIKALSEVVETVAEWRPHMH